MSGMPPVAQAPTPPEPAPAQAPSPRLVPEAVRSLLEDAKQALEDQEPLRARMVLVAFWVVLFVALIWAAVTRIDEVTKGEGKVIPSKQLQVMQSLDGGVVSEILVKEGQKVEPGQVLVSIDPTRFDSSLQENRSQYLSLLARAARLRALAEGTRYAPPKEVLEESPRTSEAEQATYEASRQALEAQLSIAQQQMQQRQKELDEARARRDQAAKAHELTAKELAFTRPLVSSGAVSEVDVMRLERDTSRYLGERDVAAAQILKAQAGIAEASRKVQEVTLNFRSDARKDLTDTLARLNVSSAGSAGLADKVQKSQLRSPVKGVVKRLFVTTVGGVVQPGKDVVEVVPSDESLLLDARVLAKDIAFIRPGNKAVVKFTAYDFSIYGGLEATVELIGADSVTDDRGNTYYMVRVRTEKAYLGQVGQGLPIIAGMVAEVDILTGQKSLLSYLLKPVLRAKQSAFSER